MASVPQGRTSSWISSSKDTAPRAVPLLGPPSLRSLRMNTWTIYGKMVEGVPSHKWTGVGQFTRGGFVIGRHAFSLRKSLVPKRRPFAIASHSPSYSGSASEESSAKEKTPFDYTRKDVLLVGFGVTVLGVGLKSGLEFAGVDPLQAGNVVQLVLVLGLTVGWISTYIFRVSNKEMTYAQQLRDHENKIMEKRIESLTEAQLRALLEQVEEKKRTFDK